MKTTYGMTPTDRVILYLTFTMVLFVFIVMFTYFLSAFLEPSL